MPKNQVKRDEFKPAIRTVGDITIFFYSKEAIHVHYHKSGTKMIYQRWFEKKRGFYSASWKPFCHMLKYSNSLTPEGIGLAAARYGVAAIHSGRELTPPEDVVILPEIHIYEYDQSHRDYKAEAKRRQEKRKELNGEENDYSL